MKLQSARAQNTAAYDPSTMPPRSQRQLAAADSPIFPCLVNLVPRNFRAPLAENSAGLDSTRLVPRINISIRRWTDSAARPNITVSSDNVCATEARIGVPRFFENTLCNSRISIFGSSHVVDIPPPARRSETLLAKPSLDSSLGSSSGKQKSDLFRVFTLLSPTASDLDSLAVSGGRTRELRLQRTGSAARTVGRNAVVLLDLRIRNRSVIPMFAVRCPGNLQVPESLLDAGSSVQKT
ncbi:hypothetical protein BJX68DRAFT_249104 [Aspergillus pseudodeflectus]|uniref:Uncharacterized protein n=1 Tax=Aspergillus pseudodeflectus TaxID=176178 RepID=A0ABR4JE17_9EURO